MNNWNPSSCKEFLIDYDSNNKLTLENCYIKSDEDILIILYKIFVENDLQLVFQRLTSPECEKFVKTGNLFAIVEKTSNFDDGNSTKCDCFVRNNNGKRHLSALQQEDGITRWTDKLLWTSSRMLSKKFLVYKQKNVKQELIRLTKKTVSIKIEGKSIRLISYYNQESIENGTIKSVKELYKTFYEQVSDKNALNVLKTRIKEINISGYTNSNRLVAESVECSPRFSEYERHGERKNSMGSVSNRGSLTFGGSNTTDFTHSYKELSNLTPSRAVFEQSSASHPQRLYPFQNVGTHFYVVPQIPMFQHQSFQPTMVPKYSLPMSPEPLVDYPYPTRASLSYTNPNKYNYLNNISQKSYSIVDSKISAPFFNHHYHFPPSMAPVNKVNYVSKSEVLKSNKTSPKLPSIKDLQLPKI